MEQSSLKIPVSVYHIGRDLGVALWWFRIDLGPLKDTDLTEPKWQKFSNDENLQIEEGFLLEQETVDLIDYVIDIKKMVQVNRRDKTIVCVIKREGPSKCLTELPRLKVIIRDQKTINKDLGTIQSFLDELVKKTPEVYTFYQRLEKLSLDCKRNEFEDLVDQVFACIEKGAKVRAQIIKAKIGSHREPNCMLEAGKILNRMKDNFSVFQEFLDTVLEIYMEETFICFWLNELLRTEDWEGIVVLTPYLTCLIYNFKLSEDVSQSQNSQAEINDDLGFPIKRRLYLYKGAALTKEELCSFLLHHRGDCFSWNGPTSTSMDIDIARNSLSLSINERTSWGVLFAFEIDFDSTEDYKRMISTSKCSKNGKGEVILMPGTLFRFLESSLIENGIYEIRLKVVTVVKATSQSVNLLDATKLEALQNRIISGDKAVVDGLPSQESLRLLESLKENKKLRKIEIRNSGVEKYTLQQIEKVRETTNVRREDIKLVYNTIVISSLNTLIQYSSPDNLSDILAFNKIRFEYKILENSQISPKLQIKHLILKDETFEVFRKNCQLKELWERLKDEIQTQGLSLLIQKTQLEDDEFRNLLELIEQWRSWENTFLTCRKNQANSDLESLSQVLSSSTTFRKLSLKFSCSDKGLHLLQNTLKPVRCLQSISLNCNRGSIVSDEGLEYLKSALILQESLQYLSLKFTSCSFSDEGLNSLASVFPSLNSLQHLDLSFRECQHISDVGLKSFKDAFTPLRALRHLSYNFLDCFQISIKCINDLMVSNTVLISLKHLKINVEFTEYMPYSNTNLLEKALVSFTPLQRPSGNFKFFTKASDEELIYLKNALESLSFLQYFSLDLVGCERISNEGLNSFTDALEKLTSLRSLYLNLENCIKISDEGLNYLRNGLILLSSLQNLSLNFENCDNISDEGLRSLSCELTSLSSLQDLSFNPIEPK